MADPECPASVQAGFTKLLELFNTKEGRDTIEKVFNLVPREECGGVGSKRLYTTCNGGLPISSLILGSFTRISSQSGLLLHERRRQNGWSCKNYKYSICIVICLTLSEKKFRRTFQPQVCLKFNLLRLMYFFSKLNFFFP